MKCLSMSLLIFNHAAMLYVSSIISLVLSFAHFGWEGGLDIVRKDNICRKLATPLESKYPPS